MSEQSITMTLFLEPFRTAAADGAVVELKLRLLAGKIPSLQKYAHEAKLENIEDDIAAHFSLPAEDRETLRLCRQLRNKVLHSDFRAARGKLNALGLNTTSGGVKRIHIPSVSVAAVTEKIRALKEGTEGVAVADASSADGGVLGWFMEAANAGDFEKASAAFKAAAVIIERLAALDI